MKRLFLYIKYFLEADTKTVRDSACKAAREYCLRHHAAHWHDNYYRDFRRFTQSYMLSYCHEAAKARLAITHPR